MGLVSARAIALGATMACASCAPVIRAEGQVLNPLARSEPLLDLVLVRPRMPEQMAVYDSLDVPSSRYLPLAAAGRVRGPDEVDIYVQIWHPWRELADLREYVATLSADGGRPVAAESIGAIEVAARREQPLRQARSVMRVPLQARGWGARRIPGRTMGSIENDLWRGRARIRFHGDTLITRRTRTLTLELRNVRQVYLFTWSFPEERPVPASSL